MRRGVDRTDRGLRKPEAERRERASFPGVARGDLAEEIAAARIGLDRLLEAAAHQLDEADRLQHARDARRVAGDLLQVEAVSVQGDCARVVAAEVVDVCEAAERFGHASPVASPPVLVQRALERRDGGREVAPRRLGASLAVLRPRRGREVVRHRFEEHPAPDERLDGRAVITLQVVHVADVHVKRRERRPIVERLDNGQGAPIRVERGDVLRQRVVRARNRLERGRHARPVAARRLRGETFFVALERPRVVLAEKVDVADVLERRNRRLVVAEPDGDRSDEPVRDHRAVEAAGKGAAVAALAERAEQLAAEEVPIGVEPRVDRRLVGQPDQIVRERRVRGRVAEQTPAVRGADALEHERDRAGDGVAAGECTDAVGEHANGRARSIDRDPIDPNARESIVARLEHDRREVAPAIGTGRIRSPEREECFQVLELLRREPLLGQRSDRRLVFRARGLRRVGMRHAGEQDDRERGGARPVHGVSVKSTETVRMTDTGTPLSSVGVYFHCRTAASAA